jgi:hypothetical protein
VHALAAPSTSGTPLFKPTECAVHYFPSTCLRPVDLQSAYFPGEAPEAPPSEPQTIALVDAYNDLNAEADLGVYANEFDLPPCTKADGCFQKVGESGGETLPFPRNKAELEAFSAGTPRQKAKAEEAEGWALETATDIEVAHAVCRNCHILLVEAGGPEYTELEAGESAAVALQADEISNSWGGPESGTDEQAFNHPGVAIVAAAGDDGYLNWDQYATRGEAGSPYFKGADYPASSPHVISVGGTRLSLTAGGAWESESAWNSEGAGGSGCSTSLSAQAWQQHVSDWAQVGCGSHRANADVSADADPLTGVNIYDSTPYPQEHELTVLHWAPIGGTSVAAPIIASMIALEGGAHGVAYPAQTLYSHLGSPLLHDVTTGGNGECNDSYTSCSGSLSSPLDCGAGAWICNATAGYDGPTGVGTPNGIGAFAPEGPVQGGEEGEPKGNPSEESEEGETTEGQGLGAQPLVNSPSGPSGPGTTPGRTTLGSAVARISALALTATARAAALHHGRLAIPALAFSFRANRATSVRLTLAIRVRSGGRSHWSALHTSLRFAAVKGLNRRRLHGSGALVPGAYRLTLSPSGGASRSIEIRVH